MSTVTSKVRQFYEELPFNFYSSDAQAIARIEQNPLRAYPDLTALLGEGQIASALEIGCGAGWCSNSLAHHYGVTVTGVDITGKALARARSVAKTLGLSDRTEFVEASLFDYEPTSAVDLVISIGVLHHTHDARAAFARIARFVKPGKYVYLALYHHHGRKVFLELFNRILAEQGEEAAFAKYAELHSNLTDETHLRSWFRDQVLHPHETQHTLEEVLGWFEAASCTLLSTSINRFEPFTDTAELIARETEYEQISYQRNHVEGRYFPGFFTMLGRREPA